ncbi:hypothetical protein ACLB2K_038731 [Fragaria x ananassa]
MSEFEAKYTLPHRMVSNANHRNAAKKLKAQLQEWFVCFTNYVSSHKAYIRALHDCARHPLPAFCEETNNNALSLLELEKWSSCLDKLFADVELEGEHYKTEKTSKTKDKSYKLMQRIKEEEVEYEASRKETEKNAVILVQTGFTSLFGSLDEFSKSFAEKYDDIRK